MSEMGIFRQVSFGSLDNRQCIMRITIFAILAGAILLRRPRVDNNVLKLARRAPNTASEVRKLEARSSFTMTSESGLSSSTRSVESKLTDPQAVRLRVSHARDGEFHGDQELEQMKLDIFVQDLKYALRTLSRDRSFTLVAVVILALAIGANIAVFSVVNTLLLRPLPFPDSSELVWIAPPPTACGFSCATYSADAYEEFRDQSRAYQDVSGYEAFTTPDTMRLTGRGEPVPATSIEVIGNFFQVLGVQPAMGRVFTADEVRGGSHPVAVLTDAYWRRQFAADPHIVGKALDLNGT